MRILLIGLATLALILPGCEHEHSNSGAPDGSGGAGNDAPIGKWVCHGSTDQTELGRIVSIVNDPSDLSILYAGTREGFVIKIQYQADRVTNDFLSMPRHYQTAVRPSAAMTGGAPSVQYLNALSSDYKGGLFAGFAGIMKSENQGQDWTQVYNMPTVFSVAVDPSDPSIAFAGTESEGVLKTSDGGKTWNKVKDSIYAMAVVVEPRGSILVGDGTGIWKSTDSGSTWNQLSKDFANSITANPKDANEIYAGTAASTRGDETLRYSNDGGRTWTVLRRGFAPTSSDQIIQPALPIVVSPANPSTVYVGTMGAGVMKSTDKGKTWLPLNDGLEDKEVFSLAIDPRDPRILYAGTASGKFWRIRQSD